MNDDRLVSEGVVVSPKHRCSRASSPSKNNVDFRALIDRMKLHRTPMDGLAMQLLRNLRAIAIVLFLLNCKRTWEVLLPFVTRRYSILAVVILTLQGLWLVLQPDESQGRKGLNRPLPQDTQLSPNFFECETTHTRLFPKTHSFSYSYLLVGIPVGWRGWTKSILSSDLPLDDTPGTRKTWFSVHAEDYLQRGDHPAGLVGKLRSYLETQNILLDDYPHVYLVTAPRFLGFSFNPVSFWYLYDQTKTLSAMILEVNNTFDERRIYFLPRVDSGSDQGSTKFVQRWGKDFHVSPFNDRDGSYSLSAIDPFENQGDKPGGLDNTIVLRAEDGNAKIIARVFSSKPRLNPAKMTNLNELLFVIRWWWVGFMTNPRILREARVLWSKGLQVFYRPEVLTSSIGRNATTEETILEPFFHALLQEVSNFSDVAINYEPAVAKTGQVSLSPQDKSGRLANATIEVKILTPAFYAEMARSSNLLHVFDQFCFIAPPRQAMASVSDPERFRHILQSLNVENTPPPAIRLCECGIHHLRSGIFDFLTAMPRSSGSRHATGSSSKTALDLDTFVRTTRNSKEISKYENACLKILLADKFALGSTSLLKFYGVLVWLGLLVSIAFHLNHWLHGGEVTGARSLISLGTKFLMLCATK